MNCKDQHEKCNKAETDFFIVALKEEARNALWQVGSSTDPDTLINNVIDEIEALAPKPEGQEDRSDEEIKKQVSECLLKAAYATRPYCIRCGTCCAKGSPTLTAADFGLFTGDIVKPSDVITIRRGELARTAGCDELERTEKELIKIREAPGNNACVFFKSGDKECSIYKSRPIQCRRQECWNPQDPDEIGSQEMLDRLALLRETGPLWDIVERHEERCSHEQLSRVMAKLEATKGHAVEELLELLRFDQHVRYFIMEKFGLALETLDFFLGRPLSQAVEQYGLRVIAQPDGGFLLTTIEEIGSSTAAATEE
jgi:Fe-S-cluster containining protein